MGKNPGEEYAERFLKEFPSHEIYEKLNEEEDPKKCSEECRDLELEFPENHKIYELCCTLEKNLRYMSIIFNNTYNNIERCRYFNFWKNDRINKIYDPDKTDEINKIRTIFISKSSIISNLFSNEECYYIYRRDISMELWKKWKILFDYIRNKNEMKKIIVEDKELCKIYKSYHAYITSIYNDYQTECCKGSGGKCPHFLNFNEWCKNEDILTQFECDDSEDVVTLSVKNRGENAPHSGEEGVLVKQGKEESVGREKGYLEPGLTRSPNPEEREQRRSSGTEGETGEVERREPESSLGAGRLMDSDNLLVGPILEDSESILPKNTGTIGATVAGSSVFLLMMYKYTPLGSWVSTKILGRNKLMENMDKNHYELLLNDVGNNEVSLNDTMYHIRYNSATNH